MRAIEGRLARVRLAYAARMMRSGWCEIARRSAVAAGIAAFVVAAALSGCGQDVTMVSTGTIWGDLIYTDGTPAAGLTVIVEGTDRMVTSDSKGRFVVNDVVAVTREGMGRYYVVRGWGERNGEPVGFIVTHFKVKGAQAYGTGVVVVQPTGSIVGAIDLEGDADDSGVIVTVEGTSLSAITRADGSFRIDGVPVHHGYVLTCEHPGYAPMDIAQFDPGDGARPVDVEPRATTDVGVHMLTRIP